MQVDPRDVLADDSHGWRLSTQLLAGLVQGMSALGPRRGFHCGTREYLQATLPVSCTVCEQESDNKEDHSQVGW